MASSSRSKRSAIGVISPSFFKAVVDEALENGSDGVLEIEGYVARKYADFLGSSIVLTDPNGNTWTMELKRSKGRVCLKKGWLEFANFYSLEQGCFIFFTHKGVHSGFQVRIFNKSHLEIDYPFKSRPCENSKLSRGAMNLENGRGGDVTFTIAKRFETSNPCRAIRMRPSYMIRGLKLNSAFVKKNICAMGTTRNIILQNSDGKKWSAKCTTCLCLNKEYAKLCGGWTRFAKENKLQVGDACVLELITKSPTLTLLVHIFRAN